MTDEKAIIPIEHLTPTVESTIHERALANPNTLEGRIFLAANFNRELFDNAPPKEKQQMLALRLHHQAILAANMINGDTGILRTDLPESAELIRERIPAIAYMQFRQNLFRHSTVLANTMWRDVRHADPNDDYIIKCLEETPVEEVKIHSNNYVPIIGGISSTFPANGLTRYETKVLEIGGTLQQVPEMRNIFMLELCELAPYMSPLTEKLANPRATITALHEMEFDTLRFADPTYMQESAQKVHRILHELPESERLEFLGDVAQMVSAITSDIKTTTYPAGGDLIGNAYGHFGTKLNAFKAHVAMVKTL